MFGDLLLFQQPSLYLSLFWGNIGQKKNQKQLSCSIRKRALETPAGWSQRLHTHYRGERTWDGPHFQSFIINHGRKHPAHTLPSYNPTMLTIFLLLSTISLGHFHHTKLKWYLESPTRCPLVLETAILHSKSVYFGYLPHIELYSVCLVVTDLFPRTVT